MTIFAVTEERFEIDGSISFRIDSIWSTKKKAEKRLEECVKNADGLTTFDIEEFKMDSII